MKNNKIEELFYKSFDGILSEKELERLNFELEISEESRKQYNRVKALREQISGSAETSFKPFFEERLLRKLNGLPEKDKSLLDWTISLAASFRRVALTGIIILVILLTYNLNNGNKHSIETLLGINKASLEQDFDPINYLIWSDKQ